MFYVNFFINLMDSIATYILDILSVYGLLGAAIVGTFFSLRFIVSTCIEIFNFIKPIKKRSH